MSWFGKVIGGTFGFVIGGPIGALIGAGLGHGFDRGMDELGEEAERHGERPEPVEFDPRERVQMAFFTATFAVMGHVSKADGHVSEPEIGLAQTVMERLALNADMRSAARQLFSQGKASDFPLDDVLTQLRRECRFSRNVIQQFLEIQLHAALADGHYHPGEREVIAHIATRLGFAPEVLAQLEEMVRVADREYRDPNAAGTLSIDSAYKMLGVTVDASDADIKRAYRRKMSQHHPDKLVSKGLPEEMIRLATEKTQQVKSAYEQIRAARKAR